MGTPVFGSLYGGPILSDIQFRAERYGERNVFVTRHLPRLKAAGLNAIVTPAESMRELELFVREVKESDGQLAFARTPGEVQHIVDGGACACILGASYATLGERLDSLPMLHELGVRLFTMSGNRRNAFIDGCTERGVSGLSDLGVADIFEVTSSAVVVASHSNTRQIQDLVRNVSADQIRQIAARGGMVGVSLHPTLVTDNDPDVGDVARHMQTMVALVGDDHVGLGTDFVDYAHDVFQHKIKAIDPTGKLYGGVLHEYPRGVETIEKVGAIFERLAEDGVDEASLAKLRGGNLMRVLGRVSPDQAGRD
jgi:membrane dipeptidase